MIGSSKRITLGRLESPNPDAELTPNRFKIEKLDSQEEPYLDKIDSLSIPA